jgi:hypothetical protein
MRKHPRILTINVPYGNEAPHKRELAREIPYRNIDPTPPPIKTSITCLKIASSVIP